MGSPPTELGRGITVEGLAAAEGVDSEVRRGPPPELPLAPRLENSHIRVSFLGQNVAKNATPGFGMENHLQPSRISAIRRATSIAAKIGHNTMAKKYEQTTIN